MAGRWILLTLALYVSVLTVVSGKPCPNGFSNEKSGCIDVNECVDDPCGENSVCFNTNGSYYCHCADGFRSSGAVHFTADNTESCEDIDECLEDRDICGANARCNNTNPKYYCTCLKGFHSSTGVERFNHGSNVTCKDICTVNKTICGNGTCHRGASSHYCTCNRGFTNYGNNESHCTALNCDVIKDMDNLKENFPAAQDLITQLKQICLELTGSERPSQLNGEKIPEQLLSAVDEFLSKGSFNDNRKVSTFLDVVERVLQFIGPLIKPPGTKKFSTFTELELLVRTGSDLPQGPVSLSSKKTKLGIQLETAAGHPSSYPGFTTVSLLSYKNLERFADGFFAGMKPKMNQTFKINSNVVTVTVSNRNTSFLKDPVKLTFYHLKQSNDNNHTCAFWDSSEDGGSWSARGCGVVESTREYTVCSCTHLSSFAVLMALYEMENKFELQLITWVGLSLSLICLFICILTFSLITSIQSPRTTIHLHLCISLFIANFIFLTGISQTENQVGCAVVAGLLHFFHLAAFCWMCLEGIQLFRMLVLVFNTSFKTLYMMAGGYGVPAVIVATSALVNAKGYGTKTYCWLNLEFIWSFLRPFYIIMIINIFILLINVWKLSQKFTSLNPYLDDLQKIKVFVITAGVQLCALSPMWIFGCFQFKEGTIAVTYLFTIFGSLQGVTLLIMHCLLSKQVREVYVTALSRLCAPQEKSYQTPAKHVHQGMPNTQENLTTEQL